MPEWENAPVVTPAKKSGAPSWSTAPLVSPGEPKGFFDAAATAANNVLNQAKNAKPSLSDIVRWRAGELGTTPEEARKTGTGNIEDSRVTYTPPMGDTPGMLMDRKSGAPIPIRSKDTLATMLTGEIGAGRELDKMKGVGAGIANTALSLAEPENAGLLLGAGAVGSAVPAAGRALSALFAAQMGHGAYQQATTGGDPGGAAVTALLAALAGGHAAGVGLKGRANIPEEPTAPTPAPTPTEPPLGASVAERLATPETPETPVKETPNAKEVVEPVGTKDVVSGGRRKVKANVKPVQPTADASPVVAEASPAEISPKVRLTKAKEAVSPAEVKPEPDVLGVKNFKTAKGSTYVVNEDGTTTRNKMARPEHPGDSGPQPKSEATWYVSPEDANKLGEFQTSGEKRTIEPVPSNPDYIGVKYTEGPNAGKFERRTVVKVSREPSVGSIPVESWKNGERVHFGNEIVEVGSVEPNTTGIAQRVHDVRSEAGKIGEITPGVGVTAPEMVERGRDLVKQGVDPVDHLAKMEDRGTAVSGDDVAILRAKYEELGKATDKASDLRRANPNDPKASQDYLDAKQAETDWAKRIKPYQTEWHKIGMAQQGETDLNTGSFTSIDRAFTNRAGRNMNPAEEVQATTHADTVKAYEDKIAELQSKVDEALKATAVRKTTLKPGISTKLSPDPEVLRAHFAKRIDDGSLFSSRVTNNKQAGAIPRNNMPNFTTSEVKAIWDHAKTNYIDKGVDFQDTVSGVARDLGLKSEWVNHAFTQNKSVRTLTNEMYRVQSYRRNAVANARAFVESAGKPGYVKAFRAMTNFPRGLAVFGHGAVGMITHAGKNIARPSSWTTYWPNFIRQFKFVARADIHEAAMQTLERSPNFVEKMRAGLKVDPNRIYDDYQLYGKFIGNVGRAGNRGMDALKVFRSEYYDHVMSKVSPELQKDPQMQEAVADWVNGASGAGSIGHGAIADVAHEAMFASSLEAGRWKSLIGDPIKTAKTVANWSTASPAEKAIATHRIKNASEIVTVLVGALAANRALQQSTGQKDVVNLTDPSQSDFLKFKWNGRTLDFTGNSVAPIRLLARVVQSAQKSDMRGVGGAVAEYGRGKLAPQYGIATDLALRKDPIGRPTPNASPEMKRKSAAKGREPYTWSEYAIAHGPIPLSGASREVYDVMREKGTDEKTAKAIIRFLESLPVEATGIRIGRSPAAYRKGHK